MLTYENRTPDVTLVKWNDHECQMYPTCKHQGSWKLWSLQRFKVKIWVYKASQSWSLFRNLLSLFTYVLHSVIVHIYLNVVTKSFFVCITPEYGNILCFIGFKKYCYVTPFELDLTKWLALATTIVTYLCRSWFKHNSCRRQTLGVIKWAC